jgi:hypothetical protein
MEIYKVGEKPRYFVPDADKAWVDVSNGIKVIQELAENIVNIKSKEEIAGEIAYWLKVCYYAECVLLEAVDNLDEFLKMSAGITDLRNRIYHVNSFFDPWYQDAFLKVSENAEGE